MIPIGEFSRITGLSIKALRFYHEKDILVPSRISPDTGYRYYDHCCIERARIIAWMRAMAFSISDIQEILKTCRDESEMVSYLMQRKKELRSDIDLKRSIIKSLDVIIRKEQEAQMALKQSEFTVEEKIVETILIAGIRYKGKYEDCGKYFGKLGRKMGRYSYGKPMNLYYDPEYKEDDADIETCFPVQKGESTDEITVRELPGGRCVSLMHKGPYDTLSRSYQILMDHIRENKLKLTLPIRETYIKGPGMILKGNPKNYLTEINIMVETGSSGQ